MPQSGLPDNDQDPTCVIAYATPLCFAYAMDLNEPCICGRLRRASRALTRRYDEAFEPIGITVTQFSVLRCLARLGRPNLVELAETTAHEKSALWRILQPLIRRGWVVAETADGERAQRLSLSPAGREGLESALPLWREAQSKVADVLGPNEAALIALLKEVETHV